MIIIFSNNKDIHTLTVADKLIKKHQECPILLDLSHLATSMSMECYYSNNSNKNSYKIHLDNNKIIELNEAKSFWWRRPDYVSIPQEIINPEYRRFVHNEWDTALLGMFNSLDGLWINNIAKDMKASHKPYQLSMAKRIGLSIPDTLITNNSQAVFDFYNKHNTKVIYKQFIAREKSWRETRPLTTEALKVIQSVRYSPVIFQEFLDNSSDIRITIIGKQIFAAEAKPNKTNYQYDFRMIHNLKWIEHILPNEINNLLLKFMEQLGLEYGAIDMKRTFDNNYYFLEINTAGEFLFIENATGLPISDTMANHLSKRD